MHPCLRNHAFCVRLQGDPEWTLEKEMAKKRGVPYTAPQVAPKTEDADCQYQEAERMTIGDRCEVRPGGKRGSIRCFLQSHLT